MKCLECQKKDNEITELLATITALRQEISETVDNWDSEMREAEAEIHQLRDELRDARS